MNKLVKVFALAAAMVFCSQAVAQTRGAMFLGASFPMKDYGKFDGFDDFALTTLDENDGGAGIGFNAGLKWYFNMGLEGLGVMLSVDGFYNGSNPDLKEAYRTQEYNNSLGSFSYNSTPKYINVPAMLGLNYLFHFNSNLGLFVEAGAGGNLRFITNQESVMKTLVSTTKTTQNFDNAFCFAYQAGIGLEVARNLVIGCSFYNLGKAQVSGEQIIKTTTLNDNISVTNSNYNKMGNLRPMMILARIGFSF